MALPAPHTVYDAVKHEFRQGKARNANADVSLNITWKKAMEIIQAVPTFQATQEEANILQSIAAKITEDIAFEKAPKLRISYDSQNKVVTATALESGTRVAAISSDRWDKDTLDPTKYLGRSCAGYLGSLDFRDTPRNRELLRLWETTHVDDIHDMIAKLDGVAPGFV